MAEKNGDAKKDPAEKYTVKFDDEEISPLKKSTKNSDASTTDVEANGGGGSSNGQSKTIEGDKKSLRTRYDDLLKKYEISEKSRKFIYILLVLLAILFVIIVVLIAVWPRIPEYLKYGACTNRQCFDASAQIVQWTNITLDVCDNPYEWACGNFENNYRDHEFYGTFPGEWNFHSNQQYLDTIKINDFLSKLPPVDMEYSAQLILKELYTSCLEIDSIRNSESSMPLTKAISHILKGWKLLPQAVFRPWSPSNWDFHQILPNLQTKYRVSPFFKISVEGRRTLPYGNIITISDGDLGLPSKKFYKFEHNHQLITDYNVFLRDAAINMGVVSDRAKNFAEEIFGYEKRIVESIIDAERSDHRNFNVVLTLKEVQTSAPSLPILQTIRSMFEHTQITETTKVLVKNIEVLRAMSKIVASSDAEVLNNFLVWSLIRNHLPFLPREKRITVENFEHQIYNYSKSQPLWYRCSKLVHKWAPFAIRGLQQNPKLINPQNFVDNREDTFNYDYELAKIIFSHIRLTYVSTVNDALWINSDITKHIVDKLRSMRVQVGIPEKLLKTSDYINSYYKNFHNSKMFFVDQLEYQWKFELEKMAKRLSLVNESDIIVDLMFPPTENQRRSIVRYSPDLNMIVIPPELVQEPYYSHKYPISVNFARLGADITEAILDAVYVAAEEFKTDGLDDNSPPIRLSYGNTIEGDGISCLQKKINKDKELISSAAQMKIFTQITTSSVLMKAFKFMRRAIDDNQPIVDVHVADYVTYDFFGLRKQKRLPELRQYNDLRLFTLVHLQRHCAVRDSMYRQLKTIIEDAINEDEMYTLVWNQAYGIAKSLKCSPSGDKCENIL